MKTLNNKDSFVRKLLLLIGFALQTLILLTIISNFGWTHILTYSLYVMTVVVYYIFYYLWKQ